MPASQNSNKYPNGCVFAMGTAFQNWVADQPAWAKWLEGVVGAAIGIALAVFVGPEVAAWAFEEAAEDAVEDVIATEVNEDIDAAVDDELATEIAEEEDQEFSEEYFRERGQLMRQRLKSTIIESGSSFGGSIVW